MRNFLVMSCILCFSAESFSREVFNPVLEEPAVIKDLTPSVSSRVGVRTKRENVLKMHEDSVFTESIASGDSNCGNWYNDIPYQTRTMIRINCNDYGQFGDGYLPGY